MTNWEWGPSCREISPTRCIGVMKEGWRGARRRVHLRCLWVVVGVVGIGMADEGGVVGPVSWRAACIFRLRRGISAYQISERLVLKNRNTTVNGQLWNVTCFNAETLTIYAGWPINKGSALNNCFKIKTSHNIKLVKVFIKKCILIVSLCHAAYKDNKFKLVKGSSRSWKPIHIPANVGSHPRAPIRVTRAIFCRYNMDYGKLPKGAQFP